jgi:Pilus assembly protein, PilO
VSVKKRKLSPVAASVLVGVVALLILLVGMFLLVMPQRSQAAKLTKEIAATQVEIVQARALAEQKPAQPIRYADLFKLVKAMPDQMDMTGIILQLQQTANDAGIEFDSIQPGGVALGSGYTTVQFSLTFNGDYYGLTDFLYRLRNLVAVRGGALDATGRMFAVDTLDFGAGATGFPQITAKLSVNAFVYGILPQPGQSATPAPAAPTDTTGATTTSTDGASTSTPPVASGAVQ